MKPLGLSAFEETLRVVEPEPWDRHLPIVTIADVNVGFCDEVEREASKTPPVERYRLSLKMRFNIHRGDLFDIDPFYGSFRPPQSQIALVSPANSFGFMDGGIDQIYTDVLGDDAVDRVRAKIINEYEGELLVGQATVVETGLESTYPYIIAAPTMRVPMVLPEDSVAPYLATRAAIRAAREYNKTHVVRCPMGTGRRFPAITHVVVPGMGTGCGLFPSGLAARQMVAAVNEVASGSTIPATWVEASKAHQGLYAANVTDLQFERDKDHRRTSP